MTAINDDTGCELVGEVVGPNVRCRRIDTIHLRTNIGHSATAIEILNVYLRGRANSQEKSLWTRHCTLVTTAVEVADDTGLQVPYRTNLHLSLVVAAKDTSEVVGITGQDTLEG